MILEGIVTTLGPDGSVNIAPMGPLVDDQMQHITLRPFQTAQTFANLQRAGQGVLHVTDDVELLAQAAVGSPQPTPAMHPATHVTGWILSGACRAYEFRVSSINAEQPRSEIAAEIVHIERLRDYFGLNRAKHAVVEAAILVTRLHLLSADEVRHEFARLQSPVYKTGGPAELRAFAFLQSYLSQQLAVTTSGSRHE